MSINLSCVLTTPHGPKYDYQLLITVNTGTFTVFNKKELHTINIMYYFFVKWKQFNAILLSGFLYVCQIDNRIEEDESNRQLWLCVNMLALLCLVNVSPIHIIFSINKKISKNHGMIFWNISSSKVNLKPNSVIHLNIISAFIWSIDDTS